MGDITDYKNKKKLRREYYGPPLSKDKVSESPINQFEKWFDEAMDDDLTDANAMTLATSTQTGVPSARIVLLKGFNKNGFKFYTNYESRKGKELQDNAHAALCFYWAELNRQIRIEGTAAKVSAKDSTDYFADRPRESQLSARASKQSTEVSSRRELKQDFEQVKQQFEDEDVPRPDNWGGFILLPSVIEFWQGRPGRLHDRIVYRKQGDDWTISRLAP